MDLQLYRIITKPPSTFDQCPEKIDWLPELIYGGIWAK
jgi:hypothetical protein